MPKKKTIRGMRRTKGEDKAVAAQAASLSEGAGKVAFRDERAGALTAGTQMRARKTRRTARRVKGKRVTY